METISKDTLKRCIELIDVENIPRPKGDGLLSTSQYLADVKAQVTLLVFIQFLLEDEGKAVLFCTNIVEHVNGILNANR